MKWYLAGPMSGHPDSNYPVFQAACQQLRAAGHVVVSPHETCPNQDGKIPWEQCLRNDVATLSACDGIILLPGWSRSRGARLEVSIAVSLGMPFRFYSENGWTAPIGGGVLLDIT